MRVRVVAELRDLGLSRERRAVQDFNVREVDDELEPFGIDAAVDDRVEHEAVVRTRRETERQLHVSSRMRRVVSARRSMASDTRQAPRLRRSTRFETARTCAKVTLLIRQALMNAAPSMLSTSGRKRSMTAAIDRGLPCTVLTVIAFTAGSARSAARGGGAELTNVHSAGSWIASMVTNVSSSSAPSSAM